MDSNSELVPSFGPDLEISILFEQTAAITGLSLEYDDYAACLRSNNSTSASVDAEAEFAWTDLIAPADKDENDRVIARATLTARFCRKPRILVTDVDGSTQPPDCLSLNSEREAFDLSPMDRRLAPFQYHPLVRRGTARSLWFWLPRTQVWRMVVDDDGHEREFNLALALAQGDVILALQLHSSPGRVADYFAGFDENGRALFPGFERAGNRGRGESGSGRVAEVEIVPVSDDDQPADPHKSPAISSHGQSDDLNDREREDGDDQDWLNAEEYRPELASTSDSTHGSDTEYRTQGAIEHVDHLHNPDAYRVCRPGCICIPTLGAPGQYGFVHPGVWPGMYNLAVGAILPALADAGFQVAPPNIPLGWTQERIEQAFREVMDLMPRQVSLLMLVIWRVLHAATAAREGEVMILQYLEEFEPDSAPRAELLHERMVFTLVETCRREIHFELEREDADEIVSDGALSSDADDALSLQDEDSADEHDLGVGEDELTTRTDEEQRSVQTSISIANSASGIDLDENKLQHQQTDKEPALRRHVLPRNVVEDVLTGGLLRDEPSVPTNEPQVPSESGLDFAFPYVGDDLDDLLPLVPGYEDTRAMRAPERRWSCPTDADHADDTLPRSLIPGYIDGRGARASEAWDPKTPLESSRNDSSESQDSRRVPSQAGVRGLTYQDVETAVQRLERNRPGSGMFVVRTTPSHFADVVRYDSGNRYSWEDFSFNPTANREVEAGDGHGTDEVSPRTVVPDDSLEGRGQGAGWDQHANDEYEAEDDIDEELEEGYYADYED